jgi:copper(I)-binding protein
MTPTFRVFAGAALALCSFCVAASAADLVIHDGWVRVPPKGARTGAAYLTIRNQGAAEDRLMGGATSVASTVEVHEMKLEKGVMSMRALDDGLALPPGTQTELKPGSYHLMLIGLKGTIAADDDVVLTLHFAKAGDVTVHLPARDAMSGRTHGGAQ